MMASSRYLANRAQQVLSTEGPAPSPCRSVCVMNPDTGLCVGCLRTLDEIAQWGAMAEADKRLVWQKIANRSHI